MTEKRYEEVWKHGKIIGAKDTKNHVSMNVKTMIRELNSQEEVIQKVEIAKMEMANSLGRAIDENEQLKKENKHLKCTIESNSQDDYIDYLKSENEQLKAQLKEETGRIIKLEQYVYTKLCPKSPNYDEEVLSEILNNMLGDV